MHKCFVVQGKKQETRTRGKTMIPDHYRCTITCAFCGRRKHYEDDSYHKQHLSAKLKNENSRNGGQHGKDNIDKDKGKSKRCGKPQEKGKRGRGDPDKKNEKNQDTSGGNSTPISVGNNPEPSCGQQHTRPMTRFLTQGPAQQQ